MSVPFKNDGSVGTDTIENKSDSDTKVIKVQNISDGSSKIDEEALQDDPLVLKPREKEKPSDPPRTSGSIFCILCLRKCPPGTEVPFCSKIDATKAQQKLTQALGIVAELKSRAMCRTCWQLIELITEFRQCCEKASKKMGVFPEGLDKPNDEWMAASTLKAIVQKRQMVQNHLGQLDVEETKVKMVARQITTAKKMVKKKAKVTTKIDQNHVPDDPLDLQPNIEPSNSTTAKESVPPKKGDYKASIYTCETCGRNFDGKHSIRTHKFHCKVDSPANEKYFSCPICSATFIEKCGLTFHLNKHKGIRPYKCRKFCDNTFFSNFARIKHEWKYCAKEGRVCDTCGKHLKNDASLKTHLQNVHGEAKYGCNTCGQMFRSQRSCRLHQGVHSEKRNHICTVCNKGFKALSSLKIHTRIHTQEKPYVCHLCQQAFTYRISLRKHIKRRHGSND